MLECYYSIRHNLSKCINMSIKSVAEDSLQNIDLNDLHDLYALYKPLRPSTSHICAFINTAINWLKNAPHHMSLMIPYGDWKTDGSLVVILRMEKTCYDLMLFSLDKACRRITSALKTTKRIDWKKSWYIFCIHSDHIGLVKTTLQELNVPIYDDSLTSYIRCKLLEETNFETIKLPDDVYLEPLKPEHAAIIDEQWPHKWPGSDHFIRLHIEINGGLGIFDKQTNELLSWVIKNHLGILGMLQTRDDAKRRGFAKILIHAMSNQILKDGNDPIGIIVTTNELSNNMFENMGFKVVAQVYFLSSDRSNPKNITF